MDTSKIDGNQPSYSSDFKQSVQLFEESFKGYQKSTFDQQRSQYAKVMDETLKTMQESANAMVNKHLLDMKQNLSHDLKEYLSSPTEDHRKKVESDIQSLKHR